MKIVREQQKRIEELEKKLSIESTPPQHGTKKKGTD
jgi:hypothetical protein